METWEKPAGNISDQPHGQAERRPAVGLGARVQRFGQPDPGFVTMLHAIRRLDAGLEPATARERAAAALWARATDGERQILAGVAAEFFALPRFQRARIAPPGLVDLALEDEVTGDHLPGNAWELAFPDDGDPVPPPRVADVIVSAWEGETPREVTLIGTGFGPEPDQFRVAVQPLRSGATDTDATEPYVLHPTRSSPGSLTIAWPPDLLDEGDVTIQVLGNTGLDWGDELSRLPTNPGLTWWPKPPPAPPPLPPVTITRITPDGQRAGDRVLIDGTGFMDAREANGSEVHIESLNEGRYARVVRADGVEIEFGWKATIEHGSSTQILLRFGFDIPPGEYSIYVVTRNGSQSAWSDRVVYTIAPWKFVVNFVRFTCLDESNEWSSADELVTAWAVAADDRILLKASREYGSVDEGDTITFDSNDREVLSPGEPVSRQLTVVTHLFEWDSDVATYNFNSLIKLSSELLAIFHEAGPTGALVPKAIDNVSGVLSTRLAEWSGIARNDLGEQRLAWTVADLMTATDNPSRSFEGDIVFNNPDSEGSHSLHFEVMRVD